MGFWQSYRNLSPKTRIFLGFTLMSYAFIAQRVSDKAEDAFGYKATEDDKEALRDMLPKVRRIERPTEG